MQEALAAAGIRVLDIEVEKHWIVERDGFIALVSRDTHKAGAAGRLTERGLAPLVWRDNQAFFMAKGLSEPAAAEEVDQLRRFQADLDTALMRA
jgi:hypothetical protein